MRRRSSSSSSATSRTKSDARFESIRSNHQQRQESLSPTTDLSDGDMSGRNKASDKSTFTVSTAATSTAAMSTDSRGGGGATGNQTDPYSPEAQMEKLRDALEASRAREDTAKSALTKSDSVILELRSNVRQLKRQLDTLQNEKDQMIHQVQDLHAEVDRAHTTAEERLREQDANHGQQVSRLQSQLAMSEHAGARESVVGELQVQLDRAHAQIITADMVRKELEDTLEAEQYTWELRCQDQDRQITQLTQDCLTLTQDLEQTRSQWKEAEEGWTTDLQELQGELDSAHRELNTLHKEKANDAGGSSSVASPTRKTATSAAAAAANEELLQKLRALELERDELQGYLDEAMKELEAVDRELRADAPNVVEPLQHLYRWLSERNAMDNDVEIPQTTNELLEGIQSMVENTSNARQNNEDSADRKRVAELEAEISVYRGDLQAREESSAELRASLKEAVALLKPLQDAVAKSDREREELTLQLEEIKANNQNNHEDIHEEMAAKDEKIALLQERIQDLTEELEESKRKVSSRSFSSNTIGSNNNNNNESTPLASLRAKRNKEEALQKMFRDAQSRFQELHQVNHSVVQENEVLQQKLQETEKKLKGNTSEQQQREDDERAAMSRDVAAEMREATIRQLEQEVKSYQDTVAQKDDEIEQLQHDLQRARDTAPALVDDFRNMEAKMRELDQHAGETSDLQVELEKTKEKLARKSESEKILNSSLKEALGLLKPLQMHLEDAEREKKDLSRKLRKLRKYLIRLENNDESRSVRSGMSSSVEWSQERVEMERQLRHLEAERQRLSVIQESNSKGTGKLQEELVEVKSRATVTQEKLESAQSENQNLSKTLREREAAERQMMDEITSLREQLQKSDYELENAKYIATSALMKVEELTVESVMDKEGNPVSPMELRSTTEKAKQEVEELRRTVQSLEKEVESSKELNESLEVSIQERDQLLHSLAEKQEQARGYDPHARVATSPSKDRSWNR